MAMSQVPEKPVRDLTGESIGLVETQTVRFDRPLELSCGHTLPFVDVAYETYGELDAGRTNAVLICHALSGDAHAAGFHAEQKPDNPRHKPGWWDVYVGPGKAIDTRHFFVICSNVLGGCKGTTGPGSINPDTGKPWGLDFPVVTIADMVAVQLRLIDHLGIEKLLCVLGGSMGGMQALEWAVRHPERMAGLLPVATTASLGAQPLAFDAVGRNAIISDPQFHNGHYAQHDTNPARGLAIARMLGHITYLSEQSMHRKFGRNLRHAEKPGWSFDSEFAVETYLDYQGEKFVDRFDANSYLYITRAMDYFDLGEGRGGLEKALKGTSARVLVISFSSDWLFPPSQNHRIAKALLHAGRPAGYLNIDEAYGHDSFLLPSPTHQQAIRGFLENLLRQERGLAEEPVDLDPRQPDEKRRMDLQRIAELIEPGASVLDLGCGDGRFLQYLRQRGAGRVVGVDIDPFRVVEAIENGIDAIRADLDQPLEIFPDRSFDYVLLSRTLQTVRHPSVVMREMLRIGHRGVVSFPNFGYWRNRHQISWTGRAPVSRNLPYTWCDTPNLHFLSLKDFEDWARDEGLKIERRIPLDFTSASEIRFLPNLRATDAIYVIGRG